MKVAIIHSDKPPRTGAHHINNLMHKVLEEMKVEVQDFYPRANLIEHTLELKGMANILFFYSLLEQRRKILQYDIIQGTTYTPLPFLAFHKPVICHFGSSTQGFIKATPLAQNIESETKKIWYELRKNKITLLNSYTRRPLRDIAEIEKYAAEKSDLVIASSEIVKTDLIRQGISEKKIRVIHNAIEDFWFTTRLRKTFPRPKMIFLNRLGDDSFTWKLKGLDRVIQVFSCLKKLPKAIYTMTNNEDIRPYLLRTLKNTQVELNLGKEEIQKRLAQLQGSIVFVASRYEGFSLSLVEAMSQGLIPVAYPVGVAPEIIHNGENGFLISSQKEAKERIGQIIENEDLRKRLAAKSFATARRFRAKKLGKELVATYKNLLKFFLLVNLSFCYIG